MNMKKRIYITPETVATSYMPETAVLLPSSVACTTEDTTEEIFTREKEGTWGSDFWNN